jgi:myosin heavy chain 6/7
MVLRRRRRLLQCTHVRDNELFQAAVMFGCNPEEFLKAFCKPRVKVGNEWVNKGQNAEQVCASNCGE